MLQGEWHTFRFFKQVKFNQFLPSEVGKNANTCKSPDPTKQGLLPPERHMLSTPETTWENIIVSGTQANQRLINETNHSERLQGLPSCQESSRLSDPKAGAQSPDLE